MKFFRALKCDIEKSLLNVGFLGAVFVTVILCFTANVYIDNATSKTYSVFETIFSLDKDIIQKEFSLSSICVFRQCLSGYITMFIPIIAVFPFMVTFCAERNSGLMRFTISRTGKIKYCLSKFLACIISGGLCVLIGVFIFGIVSAVIFPGIENYNVSPEEFEIFVPGGEFQTVLKTFLGAFIYGAVSSMPAFFLSSFCKNPYVITCIPFMFIYIWDTALSKLSADFLVQNKFEQLDKIYSFMPNSILLVTGYGLDESGKTALAFNIIYSAVLLFGFVFIMNMRRDKGV